MCIHIWKRLQFLTSADILNFLLDPNTKQAPEFVMEVTNKTRADVKVSIFVFVSPCTF